MKVEDEWKSVEEWEARRGNVFREVDRPEAWWDGQ